MQSLEFKLQYCQKKLPPNKNQTTPKPTNKKAGILKKSTLFKCTVQ
jgi:hypothetical protein